MRQAEFIVHSLVDIQEAVVFALRFAAGSTKFALSGDLGAGKTTFVKAFCQHLGVGDPVTSPSFSLVNCYSLQLPSGETTQVYHLDLYRLNSVEEAHDIGIETYLYGEEYTFIEWPALIADYLPDDMIFIDILLLPDATRKITLSTR